MDQEHPDDDDPLYENITPCGCKIEPIPDPILDKRAQFRKRSVSLDDDYAAMSAVCPPPGLRLPSTPASPCRDELLLANVSTYPSSDSLANDNTRDHSDGIWNESQVTVLTAEQRDISDGSYSSNLLLTPSSKRKNLLLQHQQRSSVDTDVLDLEELVRPKEYNQQIRLINWLSFQTESHLWPPNTAQDYQNANTHHNEVKRSSSASFPTSG